MKKYLFFLVCFVWLQPTNAQYTIRLVVNKVATKSTEDIYIAGSFNNWNPHDPNYKLKPLGTTRRGIVLKDLPSSKFEFKFTRGAWEKVETTAKGEDIPNHEVNIATDLSIDYDIAGWKDDFPDKPKPNTALPQVSILDTAFFMPQLNAKRRIWVYLPKSYAATKSSYPVIYMNDGQNLFNEQTASFGEWGIDEALDTLGKKYNREVIVIGIDHGGDKRLLEYNPHDHSKFGQGEGDKYVDFLVKTLKPFVDQKFRTKKDVNSTFIAGSSMGGLISMYAVIKYPDVFGGAGIFSPAFWTSPQIYDDVAKATWTNNKPKFFFYAGGKEGDDMIPDMEKMINLVSQKGRYEIRRSVSPLNKHNEKAWREEFPLFFDFLFR
jgi:predicted alpha/beta superfamily hydrolase